MSPRNVSRSVRRDFGHLHCDETIGSWSRRLNLCAIAAGPIVLVGLEHHGYAVYELIHTRINIRVTPAIWCKQTAPPTNTVNGAAWVAWVRMS